MDLVFSNKECRRYDGKNYMVVDVKMNAFCPEGSEAREMATKMGFRWPKGMSERYLYELWNEFLGEAFENFVASIDDNEENSGHPFRNSLWGLVGRSGGWFTPGTFDDIFPDADGDDLGEMGDTLKRLAEWSAFRDEVKAAHKAFEAAAVESFIYWVCEGRQDDHYMNGCEYSETGLGLVAGEETKKAAEMVGIFTEENALAQFFGVFDTMGEANEAVLREILHVPGASLPDGVLLNEQWMRENYHIVPKFNKKNVTSNWYIFKKTAA